MEGEEGGKFWSALGQRNARKRHEAGSRDAPVMDLEMPDTDAEGADGVSGESIRDLSRERT
jgi:hypothetical protein